MNEDLTPTGEQALQDVSHAEQIDLHSETAAEPPVPALAPENSIAESVEPPLETSAPEAAAPEAATPEAAVLEVSASEAPASPESPLEESSPTLSPAAPAAVAPNEERRKQAQAAWEHIVGARERGEVVQGFVKSAVKGGLLVEIDGYRGFLPASQAGPAKGAPLEPLVRTTIPLKVIDVDQGRKRVVVSHRRALADERRSARAELLRSLKVGEERDATVVRLADFGAFVDLGGVDALIPASELAFERVNKPSDVVSPGDRLKVRVLRVENGGKKIAVSRKGALPDPWRDHADVLRTGYVTEGKVVAKEPRLQVEIAPGVVGSLGDRDANPEDYEIGEAVEVSVRSVDYRNRRIRLSTLHSAASFSPTGFAPLGVELKR